MPIETLTFVVPGDPLPKGSTRAFMVAGKPRITSATKGLKEWENRIALVAETGRFGRIFHAAVAMRIQFFLTRPKSVKDAAHLKQPDLDKLVRAVCDALTGITYRDDKQVVELHARKEYCADDQLPGIVITLKGNTDAPIQKRRAD